MSEGLNSETAPLLRQFGRFFVTSVLGVILDLSVATLLVTWVKVPLQGAAVLGFLTALIFNYVVHTIWTFRKVGQPRSVRSFVSFVAVAGVTLGVRLGVLGVLEALTLPGQLHPVFMLLIATGISFCTNFVLLRQIVFKSVYSRQ